MLASLLVYFSFCNIKIAIQARLMSDMKSVSIGATSHMLHIEPASIAGS